MNTSNKQEAKQTVDEMYHVEAVRNISVKKNTISKKAHEVCNKFKDILEEDIRSC